MKKLTKILDQIEKESVAIGFDQVSDRSVGVLLSTLCASKSRGKFLELGTGCGLSTACMMYGMDKKSALTSVDNDKKVITIAQKYLAKDDRVNFVYGMGEEVIDSIEKNSIDIIFADTWPGKYYYLDETLGLLKVGGIYMIDDMLPQPNWPEGHEVEVDRLVKYLYNREDFIVSYISWATGVYICTKIEIKNNETNNWNPKTYNKHTHFVSALALPVVDLLDPLVGEKILDIGCGEGTLAMEIEKRGAKVIGVDMSQAMVDFSNDKGVETYVGSVTDLPYLGQFDGVFSNAVLHWVKDARPAIQNIARTLKSSGRFVCEFGGEGNVFHLVSAMEEVFVNHPEFGEFDNPWYFPSVEEYRALLESEGFRVEYIEIIPRPTPMDDIANWLDIFANGVTSHLNEEQYAVFKKEVTEILKEKIYSKKEGWVLDYMRLRVKAIKV
jgi:2-isopropylmalate synthase